VEKVNNNNKIPKRARAEIFIHREKNS